MSGYLDLGWDARLRRGRGGFGYKAMTAPRRRRCMGSLFSRARSRRTC